MADEAVLMFETQDPIPFTVANGTGIEKGAVLQMIDPFTASAPTSSGQAVAGIAAEEKIASDGKTRLGVYRGGIFRMTASGSITVGAAVKISLNSVNRVVTTEINDENILGIALETAANAETFLVELKPMVMNLA